jgi:hypothetical protein
MRGRGEEYRRQRSVATKKIVQTVTVITFLLLLDFVHCMFKIQHCKYTEFQRLALSEVNKGEGEQAHFDLTTEKAFPPLPEDRDMVSLLSIILLECCISVFLREDRRTTNKQTNKQQSDIFTVSNK